MQMLFTIQIIPFLNIETRILALKNYKNELSKKKPKYEKI